MGENGGGTRRRLARLRAAVVTDLERLTAPVVRATVDRRYLVTVVLAALALFSFAARLRYLHGGPSGDEPAYLVLTQTLQKYHSIDVMRDYANRDYWSFYHSPLDAHVVPTPDGGTFPLHSPGGPLLWLVPFILWGRAGAMGFMVGVSVLLVGNIYRFLRERQVTPGYALFTTLLVTVGTPVYMYAAMNFVEPIAALIVLYAVRVLFAYRPHPVRILVASLGLGYAPWVHPRFVTFSVMLGVALAARIWLTMGPVTAGRRRWPSLALLAAPLLVGIGALEAQSLAVFHTLNPGSAMSAFGNGPFQVPFYSGVAGLLFDRQYGLVSNFPLFLLALPGILLLLRRRPQRLLVVTLFVVAAPYLVLIATFREWFAGDAPPGRFLAVLVPLVAYAIAAALQRLANWWVSAAATVLALGGYALALTSDIVPIERFEVHGYGSLPMNRMGRLIGKPFAHYAPSWFAPHQAGKFLVWALGTTVIGVALVAYAHWRPAARPAGPAVLEPAATLPAPVSPAAATASITAAGPGPEPAEALTPA